MAVGWSPQSAGNAWDRRSINASARPMPGGPNRSLTLRAANAFTSQPRTASTSLYSPVFIQPTVNTLSSKPDEDIVAGTFYFAGSPLPESSSSVGFVGQPRSTATAEIKPPEDVVRPDTFYSDNPITGQTPLTQLLQANVKTANELAFGTQGFINNIIGQLSEDDVITPATLTTLQDTMTDDVFRNTLATDILASQYGNLKDEIGVPDGQSLFNYTQGQIS